MPCCSDNALCPPCFDRELADKRPQARVRGACWAESICRGELRARATWPEDELTLTTARHMVAALARDPRLLDELVAACNHGAQAWWQGRPARYRV
jgi:hypothetical protein